MVPIFDNKRQHKKLKKELEVAIGEVIKKGIFILGEKVAEFEKAFSKYLGIKYAVGVASGTDAITLSLMTLGIRSGDEVVVPSNCYPSVFGVAASGARPVLIDIDPGTYTLEWRQLEKVISKKTKAILAVHLYGQAADLNGIKRVLENYKRKIYLVEDCAQAHGAEIMINQEPRTKNLELITENQELHNENKEIKEVLSSKSKVQCWHKLGAIGDVSCFSFYPTKNLGCMGDGGMVVTNNEEIYKRVKLLRMYGEEKRYQSIILGRNSRLDELQAAVLLVKLKYLDKWNERRRKLAELYKSQISIRQLADKTQNYNLKLKTKKYQLLTTNYQLPYEADYARHIYHLYVIRTDRRDELKAFLEKRGIQTGIHYPKPVHLQPSFVYLGYKEGDFPMSERLSHEVLSLPCFPELKDREIEFVANSINEFYERKRSI